MTHIFLDESGDLGFDFTKNKTSRYFVITMLVCTSPGPVEKIVKRTFQSLSAKELQVHPGVLHCYKEKEGIRIKLLELLAAKEVNIITIIVNKENVKPGLRDKKHILYNYIAKTLLKEFYKSQTFPEIHSIKLVASKRETNKFLNEDFARYLKTQARDNHNLDLNIEIKTPYEDKCLQVADFACWAIFRKAEADECKYYDIISSKITAEIPLFLKKQNPMRY